MQGEHLHRAGQHFFKNDSAITSKKEGQEMVASRSSTEPLSKVY